MVSEAEQNHIEIYEDLNKNLEQFYESCDDLFKRKNENDIDSLNAVYQAKSDLQISYLVTASYSILLKLNGVDMTEHPINGEINRIKEAMTRQKEVEEILKRGAPKLETGTAKRMLRHHLSGERKAKKNPIRKNP